LCWPFVVCEKFVSGQIIRMDPNEPRVEQPQPPVLTGDDEVPRQPAPPLDPYTPAPHPPAGERHAWARMRLALIPIAVVVAIIVIAALR
jgi:hypothetical protein